MSDAAILLQGVRKHFRKTPALAGATLEVATGTTTVLLGPNGAGKTTLLRVCAGLLEADAGTVRVLGLDPARDRRALSERTAFVPDRPDAWGFLTPPELARFLAAHHPRWSDETARRLLTDLRVPADRPLSRMSRGEAMKAMLAVSLAHEPEVLLLDEPFGGLDPLVHDEVLKSVVEAMGGERRTILVATHDLDVAARIGDRVAVLADGRIAKELPIEAVVGDERVQARREALKGVLASAARGE